MVEQEHYRFQVTVEGTAYTGYSMARPAKEQMLGTYRYASRYTKPGEHLRRYINEHPFRGSGNRNAADFYMKQLYRDMKYQPGVTGVSTTAEEALSLRQGVCQDYAHILIALLRMRRIPARYVVGIMEGEGASHAWVEVEEDGLWYAIDPTNNRWVSDGYVHISCGRDAYDCPMNKGVFIGGGTQTQTVRVLVKDADPIPYCETPSP